MKTPLSLFGLWVSRSLRSLVLILLGLSVLEGIFAFRALSLQSTPMLEQGLKSAHMPFFFALALAVLTWQLFCLGQDEQSHISYTLRCLSVSRSQRFLIRALHHSLCYLLLWGAQIGIALLLCQIWQASFPGIDIRQAPLLAFFRIPFLHNLLPLESPLILLWNILWCICLGTSIACEGRRDIPIFALAWVILAYAKPAGSSSTGPFFAGMFYHAIATLFSLRKGLFGKEEEDVFEEPAQDTA